jgi:HAD superfamily hydrolase (TIGR01458 family)
MGRLRAALIDIDGVLTVSWRPLPGAAEALARLRHMGLALALLTNTTSRTRAAVTATLVDAGLPITADDVVTAPALTASYIAEHYPDARCLLLNSGDIRDDLTGVRLVEDDAAADVVIIGGAGTEFSYAALNRVFVHLRNGARLVAMHRNLYWRTHEGLQLDGGAFLLGLEAAASVTAEVVGKPAPGFFTSALSRLYVDAAEAVMIGDDIDADVLGAQRLGITGMLVKTGKFLPEALESADGIPDYVVGSIIDVPDMLPRIR